MVDNPSDLNRDEIGRKGGSAGSTTMRREETAGQKVKEGWNDFKAKVKGKWNQLTDKDLDTYQSRNRNDFVGYVHNRVGGDRGMIERDVDNYARETNYRW